MTLKQKISAVLLPFVIIALLVVGGHIKNDIATPNKPLKWKIVAGYSESYTNKIGIAIYPWPYTNTAPLVTYFNPKDVYIAEIDDSGKIFTYKYLIQTNNL